MSTLTSCSPDADCTNYPQPRNLSDEELRRFHAAHRNCLTPEQKEEKKEIIRLIMAARPVYKQEVMGHVEPGMRGWSPKR